MTIQGYYTAGKEHQHAKPFRLDADEPPLLVGGDKGANPVEYLLAALSSCMTNSIIYHAATRGITIESLESEFTGDLDLQGFLDLSKDVPKGFQNIEVTFKVKTDATENEIAKLYHFSPVYSMLSRAVPIHVKVEKIE